MEKTCNKCKITKTVDCFYNDSSKKDRLSTLCKKCIKERIIPENKKIKVTEKICSKCKIKKSADSFSKDNKKLNGLQSSCKDCDKIATAKYIEENRDIINEKKAERRKNPEMQKKEKEKYKEYYHRPEVKQRYEEYRNKPETKKRMEEYYKDPINKERKRIYIEENKPKMRKIHKERYENDENYRLRAIIRARIHKALKRNKNNSSFDYLGCDIDFLKKWLEFRFDDDMNWDNFGSYWHIDHILPVSAFDLTDKNQTSICFHWTNLQPLSADENLSKLNKIQLHYFFNNIVNMNRFNSINKDFLGYQTVKETLQWLKKKDFRYGKNALYDIACNNAIEMDNPQPSPYVRYDKDMGKAQRLDDSGSEKSNQLQ
jgi:hypothetical protein